MKTSVHSLKLSETESVPCSLRRSSRARRITIRVRPDASLELIVPEYASEKDALAFLEKEILWVRQTMKKMRLHKDRTVRQADIYPRELAFLLEERVRCVHYEWMDVCWTAAKIADDSTILVSGSVLTPDAVHDALISLIRRTAERLLPPLLEELSVKTGLRYSAVTVRMQKRRWGSCSARRAISLNALLVLFPRPLVEYVIIHELCHLREMNHSPDFWTLVRSHCPDAVKFRASLNYESRKLPRYFWE